MRAFRDRQLVVLTDAEGRVIVPGLRSFEHNVISFAAEDLPLSVDFDNTEFVVTPGYRTGHRIAFSVTRPFSLMARIFPENGAPLPAGATIVDADTGEEYPVGSGGAVFVPNAGEVVRLSFRAAFERCDAIIIAPDGRPSSPVWDAGWLVCHATTMAALQRRRSRAPSA